MTKKLLVGTVVGGLMLGSFVGGNAMAKGPAKGAAKTMELTSLKDMTWAPLMKEGPLPAMTAIQGDPMKAGGFMGFLKLPAGFESPPHSHSSDYWTVLVQGKMTHWAAEGGSEKDSKQLAVGDVTFMPAKLAHVSKCFPGADCLIVMVQKGKFDFVPVAAAKDAAKDAAKEPMKK